MPESIENYNIEEIDGIGKDFVKSRGGGWGIC
jgi:hypothetical protein